MTRGKGGAVGRYDPERHHRRSIRLRGYDYSQSGAYFVTIVAQDRSCIFGDVVDGVVHLNKAGCMLANEWRALTGRFPAIQLDAFVIMPNHIHGIIVIDPVGAPLVGTPGTGATTRVAPTLGNVVGAYKSLTTFRYAGRVKSDGWLPFAGRLWQRNYYEHVIRDEDALNRIRQYIAENPVRWAEDPENPVRTPTKLSVGAPPVAAHDGPAREHGTDSTTANVGAPPVGAQPNQDATVGAPLVGAPESPAHG